jgi:hypothetical protein
VGATEPATGKTADVLAALQAAQGVVQRLVVNGGTNNAVSAALKQVAADFHVSLVQGVLSHQLKRFVIDGNKVIIGREEVDQKADEVKFETNEVYCLDLVFSSSEGKPRESEARTTVFKRALDVQCVSLSPPLSLCPCLSLPKIDTVGSHRTPSLPPAPAPSPAHTRTSRLHAHTLPRPRTQHTHIHTQTHTALAPPTQPPPHAPSHSTHVLLPAHGPRNSQPSL